MAKDWLTDEQVENEIEMLRLDPMVQLARKEQRLKYKRRQELYKLRNLQKRGLELTAQGIDYDNIETELFRDLEDFEDCTSDKLPSEQTELSEERCDGMAKNDIYNEPQIVKFPGMTVRVFRPILTDEERAKRMQRIHDAAARLLLSVQTAKTN